MKVILIGDYPPPHGGVAVHVQQLHGYLQARGVESRVLDIGKAGRPDPNVLPVRTPARLFWELGRHASKGATLHLHTSGNNPKAWALVALVGMVPSTAKVVTLHSGLLPQFLAATPRRRRFARTALRGFHRIVAVSEPIKAALLEAGVEAGRITVHPAFCASQVRPGPLPRGFELARARRQPLVVMAHHPSPVYGREVMFRALRLAEEKFSNIGLALFGPGLADDSFAEAVRNARVASHLETFGELDHDEALALISGCDAFIRPTTADGDSISVREALTLGIPCVASDVTARPEGTVTFRSGDAEDLVAKLAAALARGRVAVRSPDAGPAVLALYEQLQSRNALPCGAAEMHAGR